MFAYRCHEETASLNHQPRTRGNVPFPLAPSCGPETLSRYRSGVIAMQSLDQEQKESGRVVGVVYIGKNQPTGQQHWRLRSAAVPVAAGSLNLK
jgi:hypothetical protein